MYTLFLQISYLFRSIFEGYIVQVKKCEVDLKVVKITLLTKVLDIGKLQKIIHLCNIFSVT